MAEYYSNITQYKIMFTGFIYRHIQIGVLYVNEPFYELLSEKKFNHFSHFSKLLHYFIMRFAMKPQNEIM